jgi:Tfp pilus assembly protein PilW
MLDFSAVGSAGVRPGGTAQGFSLAEFLISTLVTLLISAAVFSIVGETQWAAAYQTEVQAALCNARLAITAVDRHIRQAGNDPLGAGFQGITIISPTEVHVRSDLTGSAGPGNPDKGDPDGDINDSGEDVAIRYNAAARSLELVPAGGSAQTIADSISGFSMQYYDGAGAITNLGANVRRINVTVSACAAVPSQQTHEVYGVTLNSDVHIATR